MTHLRHSCELRHHNRCTLGKSTVIVQNFVITENCNKEIDQKTFGTYLHLVLGVFDTELIFVVAGASELIRLLINSIFGVLYSYFGAGDSFFFFFG